MFRTLKLYDYRQIRSERHSLLAHARFEQRTAIECAYDDVHVGKSIYSAEYSPNGGRYVLVYTNEEDSFIYRYDCQDNNLEKILRYVY